MRKKRIAMIVPSLWNGGAEKVAADMSLYLSDAGYDVFFFLNQFDRKNSYHHKGREVVVMQEALWSTGNLCRQICQYQKWAWIYRKYKRQYQIDISISFMVPENFINVLSDIGDRKILTFHSVTSQVANYYGQVFVKPYILKMMCIKATNVVSVSKYVKRDLENLVGKRGKKIEVIYNSIDERSLKKITEESIAVRQCEDIILYVGRLDDEKRPWIIVRVMQEVIRRHKNAKLLMLGRGENWHVLKRLIDKFNLEKHVELLGFVNNVAQYMVCAKMIVFCSEAEACPCAMLEAIAVGLPIVTVDCPGGIREIISSDRRGYLKPCKKNEVLECGIVTPPISTQKNNIGRKKLCQEEKMLAQGVCMLLDNDNLCNCLGRNAKEYAQRFSKERIRKEWLALLEKI